MADVRRRLLQLLELLQTGRGWSAPELARRIETSPRSLRRDIQRLRDLGYNVASQPGPGGHYRLVAGAVLPPLLLTDDEAVAVAVGLRLADVVATSDLDPDAASGALQKVERVLPSRLVDDVHGLHEVTEVTSSGLGAVAARLLTELGSAAASRQQVDLDYRDREGNACVRRIDPYRLVLERGRWYLLAFDRDRSDWRTFRLDRIERLTVSRTSYRPRPLPAESAAAYLRSQLQAARHRAVVTFLAPMEQVADRLATPDGELTVLTPDSCRFTTHVDSFTWLAVRLAVVELPFRIEEPIDFVAACRDLSRTFAQAASSEPQ